MQVGASSVSVLRSVWQTYWLHENWNRQDNALDQIARSLSKMEDSYEDFIQQLNQTGWDINEIKLKVPKEVLIYQMDHV